MVRNEIKKINLSPLFPRISWPDWLGKEEKYLLKIEEPMDKNILEPDYENKFQETNHPSPILMLLRGLAAAIQDSHPTWRPTLSELATLLRSAKDPGEIVLAGSAYGAAKAIKDDFPDPSILLFGAALNAIGSAPPRELNKNIDAAEKKLKESSLYEDTDIKMVLEAAKQRAKFDRVGETLKQEFTNGLKKTGKYTDELIAEVVPKVVNITHDVRHKGLIDKIYWRCVDSDFNSKEINIPISKSSTNISFLYQENRVIFEDDSEFGKLIPYAQEGCAYAILSRMEDCRKFS